MWLYPRWPEVVRKKWQCNAFAARGAKIQVITVMGATTPLELHCNIELDTVERKSVSDNVLSRIQDNVQRVLQITQHVRRHKSDLIIGHVDRTNILAILAGVNSEFRSSPQTVKAVPLR